MSSNNPTLHDKFLIFVWLPHLDNLLILIVTILHISATSDEKLTSVVDLNRMEEGRMLLLHEDGVFCQIVVVCDITLLVQKECVIVSEATVLVFAQKFFNCLELELEI
jgi:hypothetical protein